MLIKRVRAGTECAISENQCGFRQSIGCTDQVFASKFLVHGEDQFWGFMDLENENTIDWHIM